ncbi:MAG: sterol desaturase family protein, partial [Opitutaceae bacterium]|nr:sterol desaturase family protein [Opitutaceae bacterium]
MSVNPLPAAESSSPETRNARGEWRPPYPIRYAPVFRWPLRLGAMLKWVVSNPGFMWPRNLLLLSIAGGSWYLTQPALPRCVHFEAGWIGQVYLRNLVLMWLYYGAYHLYLYTLRRQGTKGKYDARWPAQKSRQFLFGDQVYDNIFWTSGVALLVWTGYEVLTLWLYANHHIPYLDWARHPVWFV